MTFTDRRFGLEVITDKGKIYKFDSYECAFPFMKSVSGKVGSVWVADFSNDGKLIRVEDAFFLWVENIKSPMGKGILAATSPVAFDKLQGQTKRGILRWKDVEAIFNEPGVK